MKSLRVPGTLDSLPTVAAFVTQAAENGGLDEPAAYGLRLAVDEIATNAIEHGYQEAGQTGEFKLIARITADKFTIVLESNSPPYDPRQTPPPGDLEIEPGERPAGGFGVFLALQGVDAFRYDRIDGVNRHTFVMNRTT